MNVVLEKGYWQIEVFDLFGKTVFDQKASLADGDFFEIDASKMASGLYFLKVQNLAAFEKSATIRWIKI